MDADPLTGLIAPKRYLQIEPGPFIELQLRTLEALAQPRQFVRGRFRAQVAEIVDLAAYHASKTHGHENTQNLKEMIKSAVVYEEVLSEGSVQETDF